MIDRWFGLSGMAGISGLALAALAAISLALPATSSAGAGPSFKIDVDPPVAWITPLPGDITASKRPALTFGATDASPVSFTCDLDSVGPIACVSPWTVPSDLADGSHSLVVQASDGSNTAYAPAYAFIVDTIAPTLTLIAPQPGAIFDDPAPVIGLSVVGGTATCSYDDNPYVTCDALFVANPLANGPHKLCVRAVDTAGNATQQCVDFSVDALDNIIYGPAPTVAKMVAGRGGRVVRGKFKTKLSLRITPTPGANMEAACWGKAAFSIRPKLKRAKTVRKLVALTRSGADCVAVATLSQSKAAKGKRATAQVTYAGSVAIGSFRRSVKIKRL